MSPLLTPGSDVSFYTGILQTDISMVFYFFRIVNSHSLEESGNFLRVKEVSGLVWTCVDLWTFDEQIFNSSNAGVL